MGRNKVNKKITIEDMYKHIKLTTYQKNLIKEMENNKELHLLTPRSYISNRGKTNNGELITNLLRACGDENDKYISSESRERN